MKRRGAPKELHSADFIVGKLLGRLHFKAENQTLFDAWDRVLGPESSQARAQGIKKGALVVLVDSSPRLYEMTLRKRGLLQKLQEFFGGQAPVHDIIFRLGDSSFSDDNVAQNAKQKTR